MKVVLSQVNVGSKFRFMPSGVNSSLSNYPRDGWMTEAAARKWAKANGHEIVKVEKAAGKGEKIYNIEYTYKDRFGKTKKFTSALVGKDVEPLKKRIVEGLTRNGDTLVSFGKITTKDSAEDSLVQRIADKYAMDADEKFFFEVLSRNGRVISRIKAPETISKAIAFRLADQESAKFKKPWAKCRIVDSKGKTFETYNRNFKTNEFVFKNMDASDDSSIVSRIAEKYAMDAIFPTSKGFANEKGLLKRDTRKGLKPYEVTFVVKGNDGRPFNTKRSKMAASIEEAKKWAQSESKKYNGVTKIDVKEFKDSADDFASDAMDRIRAKYCLDATKDQSNKKRYEVHYQATEQVVRGGFAQKFNLDTKKPLKVDYKKNWNVEPYKVAKK